MPIPLFDSALIVAIRRGDPGAFGEVVLRYQSGIRARLAVRLTNPHGVENHAQEIFLTTLRRHHDFDITQPPGPWLRGIAVPLPGSTTRTTRTFRGLMDEVTLCAAALSKSEIRRLMTSSSPD